MFCSKCGAQITDNAKFCVSCGNPVDAPAVNIDPYGQVVQPTIKMKWFKFVIYFSLWAGAVLNALNGIITMTGAQYDIEYEGAAELIYAMFEDLKTVDVVYGVLMIALAVFMIFTRFRLAGFYKNGPAMFISTYAISVVIDIAYIIAVMSVCGADLSDVDTTNLWVNIVTRIVMIAVNVIYFGKRKHLFVK